MGTHSGVQYKINTPSLSHTTSSDWEFVYEPAEDTFLLLDTLEKEMDFIMARKPQICLEVGSGSGIIITALSEVLRSAALCLAVDVNKHACHLTQKTSVHNNTVVDVIAAELTTCFKNLSVDLVIFNPPYVVTTSDELEKSTLTKSWAGGVNGREVIDRFLENVHDVLDKNGFGYILLLKQNDPADVIEILSRKKLEACISAFRKLRGEELYVIKFQKISVS